MDRRRFLLMLPPLALASCGRGSGKSSEAQQGRQRGGATVSITRVSRTPTPRPTPPPQVCLVTREKGVPATYVPPDLVALPADQSFGVVQLRSEAAGALLQLLGAAQGDGQRLVAVSGYRSYDEQVAVLEEEIRNYGELQARRQVAEPGHSEHQLGVAVDVTAARMPDLDQSLGQAPEGRWLAAYAPRFGFVHSYPLGKEAITGYIYEPWHIRYVTVPLAQRIVASGLTVTEYLPRFGMSGCPNL